MKTIDQYMKSVIQKSVGHALAIGPTDVMYQALEVNQEITVCDVLNRENGSQGKRRFFSKRNKPFQFKKMRKTFGKKQKNLVIGDIKELERYFKTFIRDSIYITKGDLYLFTTDVAYDFDLLIMRYKRFSVTTQIEKCKDGTLLILHVGEVKNHWWKEKIYYVIDVIIDFVDLIGDALVS